MQNVESRGEPFLANDVAADAPTVQGGVQLPRDVVRGPDPDERRLEQIIRCCTRDVGR